MPEAKYRQSLNSKQLQLLKIIYKFRFVSVELVSKTRTKKDIDVTRGRLKVLIDQEYVGRNFDGSYRLQNKPASYFLLPKGIKALKVAGDLSDKVLHAVYYDKNASEQFIDHCLKVFAIYRKFNELYPNRYDIFSKSELVDLEDFPKLLSDLYLADTENRTDFFLDSIEPTAQHFTVKRKLSGYIQHSESDDWEESERDYPSLLLICGTPGIETRLQKQTAKLLSAAGADISAFTTSQRAFMETHSSNERIWTDVSEPDELIALV